MDPSRINEVTIRTRYELQCMGAINRFSFMTTEFRPGMHPITNDKDREYLCFFHDVFAEVKELIDLFVQLTSSDRIANLWVLEEVSRRLEEAEEKAAVSVVEKWKEIYGPLN